MSQSIEPTVEKLNQRIEQLTELLAQSIAQVTTEREQRSTEYQKIQQLMSATAQANAENSQQICDILHTSSEYAMTWASLQPD